MSLRILNFHVQIRDLTLRQFGVYTLLLLLYQNCLDTRTDLQWTREAHKAPLQNLTEKGAMD